MPSTRRSTLIAIPLAIPLALAALAGPASAGTPRVGHFTADLGRVNTAGSGHVDLVQQGSHLDVALNAAGLDGGIHLAHIHGIRQAMNECPTGAFDTDGNGLVDFAEGLPAYGPVQVTLSNGTNDRGTTLSWVRDFTHLDGGDGIASLGSLDQYVVVIHGVDVSGDGLATNPDAAGDGAPNPADNEISMPALCGMIHAGS